MYIQKRTFSMQTYLVSRYLYRSQIKVFALSTFCSFHIIFILFASSVAFSQLLIFIPNLFFTHCFFIFLLFIYCLLFFFIVVFFCSNLFFRTMSIGFLIKLCFVALFLHRVFPRRIAHRSRKVEMMKTPFHKRKEMFLMERLKK